MLVDWRGDPTRNGIETELEQDHHEYIPNVVHMPMDEEVSMRSAIYTVSYEVLRSPFICMSHFKFT